MLSYKANVMIERACRQQVIEDSHYGDKQVLLLGRQFSCYDPLIRDDSIIFARASNVSLVNNVPPGLFWLVNKGCLLSLLLLVYCEALHQLQGQVDLQPEKLDTLVRAFVNELLRVQLLGGINISERCRLTLGSQPRNTGPITI